MLDLVRSLNNTSNDAVIAAIKIEGELLDNRLLNQKATDEEALRQTRQRLAEDRDRLEQILNQELQSLNRISSQHASRVAERDPITIPHAPSSTISHIETPSAPTAEKIVDFWRGKQIASHSELKSIEAQLVAVKSKIEDVRTASDPKDLNGPAKLMCTIGALRQKLQQARARTKDYQKLLSSVEDIALPTSQHAAGALSNVMAQSEEAEKQSDYDQEALSLCLVETSLVNELECARCLAQYSQLRKQSLETKIAFFAKCLEEGQLTLSDPPEQQEWPPLKVFEPTVSDDLYNEVTEKESILEAERVTSIREKHVSMMRQMDGTTMDRWIEKQRLVRLAEHTERQVNTALNEKATILYRLDEISTHAKVNTALLASTRVQGRAATPR